MNERWVCKRCFADNDETSVACARCGLTRGAESAEADRQAWASEEQARAFQRADRAGWQRWLRFWWIPAIVVALAVGYFTTARRGDDGALTTSGTVGVDDLRPGDCFNAGDETEISEVDGVPCDEPHGYEVFAVGDRETTTFPGDAEMESIFNSFCVPEFESYVGHPYEDSAIYASMITPSEAGWEDGDREYICYLYEPVDSTRLDEVVPLTESMRDAAR